MVEFLTFELFIRAVLLLFVAFGVSISLYGVYGLVLRKWFSKEDFWGDTIKGRWRSSVQPGARHLLHSFDYGRCNYCGQKNLAELEYTDHHPGTRNPARLRHDNTRHYLCGSCGAKYDASLFETKVSVLRECTDPIPELRRPATHARVLPDGLEVRVNVCKTCNGDKWVPVPSSGNTGELWGEWKKARCPDCYRTDDDAPVAVKSARRMAIEHTKAKWHESEKRNLQ